MSTHSLLQDFASTITKAFSHLAGAEPEAQLSTPTENLISQISNDLKLPATLRRETRAVGGRPDFGVDVNGALCGYIELKAPGLGARPQSFKGRNKEQWQKFQSLPNLIYTDGNEWTLLRSGETIDKTVRLVGDIKSDGAASVSPDNAEKLEALLRDFLMWQPVVPSQPRELAKLLAPLCRLIRADVLAAVEDPESGLTLLAQEWRRTLFPEADNAKFADSYAQTLTYGLLLARVEGGGALTIESAAQTLDANHNLLAQAVRVLGQTQARDELGVGVDVLLRVLNALGAAVLSGKATGKDDPWLYFYEDFLAAYDSKLRKDAGVYYTPHQVIRAQVRLIDEVLRTRLDKKRGFNSQGVTVLDPAAGTGAYPLAVIDWALDEARKRGAGALAGAATDLASRVFAFEFLVGPYAVAHLRLTQALKAAGGHLPAEGAPVYLCDTLESPTTAPTQTQLFTRRLSQEHERARAVKNSKAIWVCLGNPPYDRQTRTDATQTRKGGWIRAGDGTIENPHDAPLEDFLRPASESGNGNYLANLYNDYVYFWRFALWKVFESIPTDAATSNDGGIVSFITASSYLRGPGFVGMRQMMRETFDELWILDLEGDKLGARKTDGVFNITVGTCIALGVKNGNNSAPPPHEIPARVRYAKITGTTEEKLARLDEIEKLADVQWFDCPDDWQAPFLPRSGNAMYWDCPLLTDLFPWQLPGLKWHRTWPIGETPALLEERWNQLMIAQNAVRGSLFRETTSRQIEKSYTDEIHDGARLTSIQSLPTDSPTPSIQRYGFRSFDRQWILNDPRLCDRMRPTLWKSYGPRQVFFTGMTSEIYGDGPALTATPYIPDLHHFSGRGGKDIIPLWRDANATQANVTAGALEHLGTLYGRAVEAPDLFAAVYALLFPRAYVERFSDELLIPGPRVPLPADVAAFEEAANLGHQLIRLHTWNERDLQSNAPTGEVVARSATYDIAISPDPADYPENFAYDEKAHILRVGGGEFGHVAPAIWNYSVSGLNVVESWLKYRMKAGAGRSSSPLDEFRPAFWSDEMSIELQELLWTLEASLELETQCAALLETVLSNPLVPAADLPVPTVAQRKAPGDDDDETPDLAIPFDGGNQ